MDGDAWWYGGGGGGGNNWDLGAVVRFGCGGGRLTTPEYDPFSSFLVPPMTQQALPAWGDDLAWMAPLPGLQTRGWAEAEADTVVVDDLSGAFFAAPASAQPPAPQVPAPPQVLQQPAVAAAQVTPPNLTQAADAPPPAENPRPDTDQQAMASGSDGPGAGARAGGSRSARRKKKQQTKEVVRVPANGPPPDSWAWRKYGQKPIKGSPYPRGYYRCSSNKNCAARKQVERCRVDPSFLVLTYTGVHVGHDVPLHRNSLAGTTRHKLVLPSSSTSMPDASADEAGTSKKSPAAAEAASSHSQSPGQSTSPGLSPTTPLLTSSMELHGEEDCDVDGAAELQVDDMDMAIDDEDEDEDDDDELVPLDVADETIHTVPWGTPIADAIIAASYEWR